MDGRPPLRSVSSRGLLVGVVMAIFLLLLVFALLSEREDARNIPPEERPATETVR